MNSPTQKDERRKGRTRGGKERRTKRREDQRRNKQEELKALKYLDKSQQENILSWPKQH